MSKTTGASANWDEAGRYQIRVRGHLTARWGVWFDGMTLTQQDDGTTVIDGTPR